MNTFLRVNLTKSPWFLTVVLFLITAAGASAQISGTVFRDFNADGTYQATPASGTYTYGEPTAASVVVTAYNAANTAVTSATTGSAGTYTLTTGITNGTAYRIDFTGLTNGDFTGSLGTSNASSVQFITAATTATAVNFGINYPADYCQANPPVATSCYVYGNQLSGPSNADPVFITFPFNAGSRSIFVDEGVTPASGVTGAGTTAYPGAYDQPTAHPITTVANQVGTTFGIAYARATKTFYTSAFFKRHAGFGPGGPGAIYVIDGLTGAVSRTFSVPNATLNSHNVSDYKIDNGNVGWDAVGKTSLGGMDLSDDEKTLYVMNLENRNLYALNPTSGSVIANAPMTAVTGCPVGDVRPFAVEFRRGTLYVGIICTAESTPTTPAALRGYVYTADPTTLALSATPVFQFPLTYPRGKAASTGPAGWLPWRPTYTNISTQANTPATATRIAYPMPLFTGIDFDANNDLIIGLRDRTGDIVGHNTPDNPASTTLLTQGRIAGDMLRAASTGTNSWTLESNGRAGGRGTSLQGTNQGPGGAEFYQADSYPVSSSVTGFAPYSITSVTPAYNYTVVSGANTVVAGQISGSVNGIQGFGQNHDEVSLGTLVQLPGQGEVLALVFDPVPDNDSDGFFDGGFRRMSNVTGGWAQGYRIYVGETNTTTDFGKAAGLSEPVAQCNTAPIEIGQRVWNDLNRDGIQNANETTYTNVAGLTVQLLSGATVIGTTTVAPDGTYLFSSVSTPAIQPNTAYQVRLVLPDNSRNISPQGVGSNTAVNSDATPTGLVSLTTGNYGENNHTYDIGVYSCVQPTGTGSSTAASCVNNVPQANARVAVTAITNGAQANISQGTSYTGVGFGDAGNQAITANAVSFTGLAGGQTYVVRVFSGTATCSQDFTVIVSPAVCCSITLSNVVAGPCSTTTNQFVTTGTVNLGSSVNGTLFISNGSHTIATAVTTATTSVTFALTAESDGTTRTLSASLANCGTSTTTVQSPAACYTACASGCSPVYSTSYGTGQVPANEFAFTNINTQARYGSGTVGGNTYETAFLRPGNTTPLRQGEFAWTNGQPASFTLTYNPLDANPANRLIYTVSSGTLVTTITANPQNPGANIDPAPINYNAIQLFTSAASTATAAFQSTMSNLALNGSPLNLTVSTPVGSTSTQSQTVILRTNTPNQPFTITGDITFTWSGATPGQSQLNATVGYGVASACASPPAITVTSGTLTCQSNFSAITVTATSSQTAVTYQWTGPASFTANTASFTTTTPGRYTVVSTNQQTGCSSTTTTTVTQEASATATLSSATICAGTSATLTATGGTSYTLSTGAVNTSGIFSLTPSSTATYSVTATNASGCVGTATGTITVNPSVTATVNSATITCQSPAVTLTVSSPQTGLTYQWRGPAGFSATTQSVTVATPGTYTVVTTIAQTGCASTTTAIVAQNVAAPVTTVNSATLTCQTNYAPATLTASSQAGTTFRWTGPNAFTASTASISAAIPGTYTVVSTNPQSGCPSTNTATVSQDGGVSATLTQSSCQNNGTETTATDDYFTVTLLATNTGNAGTYEVLLNGTVLNPGGTAFGTSVTLGGAGQGNARGFKADGTTTYPIQIRQVGQSSCQTYRLTGTVAPCSSCAPVRCRPVPLRKQ